MRPFTVVDGSAAGLPTLEAEHEDLSMSVSPQDKVRVES